MLSIPSFEFSKSIPMHVRKLLEVVDVFCLEKEQWEDALTLLTIALKELKKALGSNSRDVGLILTLIGFINAKMDKHDETESFLEEAISILDKYNGESNFAVDALWRCVEALYKNCKHEEAEFFGKIATEFYGKLHKIDTWKLAELNEIVGKSCLEIKKPDEAKEFLQSALSFYAKNSTSEFFNYNVKITEILKLLEIAYFWRNNIAESEDLFENSNEIEDVTPLCSIGKLCQDGNLPSKAVDYYQRAVKIYERRETQDDSQLADISLKLGKCYLKIGNYLESQNYLNNSLAIYKRTLADDDPVMLDVKIHLALFYIKTARFDKAKKIYENILSDIYTDEGDVSILDLVRNNKRSKVAEIPMLNDKFNVIFPVLMKLGALYVLDDKYEAAKILQNFGEPQCDRIKHDGN